MSRPSDAKKRVSRSGQRVIPRSLIGAVFGGVGALPLLPLASGLAIRFSKLPSLPGAERSLGDIKAATYVEAAVLLVAIPLVAVFFALVLSRLLDRRFPEGQLSFEWAAAGFSLSFLLTQRGVRPKYSLGAGVVAALLLVTAVAAFRTSIRFRRFFSGRIRPSAFRLALAGASLDLARRSGPFPPRNLVDDLALELGLSALALFLLFVGIGLFGSKAPTALLHRAGRAAAIPIVLASAGLLFPDASRLFAAGGLVSLAVALWPSSARVPWWAGRAALLLLLLVCGWKALYVPGSPIDIFEDGHSLAFAQGYLKGARPYLDTSPMHGWGADGGVDALAFRITQPTFEIFQLRHAAWAALALVLMASACVVAFGPGWGTLAFLFTMSLFPHPIERQMLAFAALLCLVASARRKSRALAFTAGVLAAWEGLHSLDYGLIVGAAGFVGLLLLPALESGFRRIREALSAGLRWAGSFALGALAGAFPFLILLAFRGGLGAFFRTSFLEIPRWSDAVWGLPAGSAWNALLRVRSVETFWRQLAGEEMSSLFFLVVLAIAAVALLTRSLTGVFDSADSAGWIAFAVAAFAMRAVLGRADPDHLIRYSVFTALPAAWLLLRAARSSGPRVALLLSAALLLDVRLHPFETLQSELTLVEGAARRDRAVKGGPAPRSGGALLPAEQAETLTRFRQYLDVRLAPGETFFDFSNRPALYFVADRLLPIRYHTVAQYEAPEKQKEVIRELETRKPPIALLAPGPYEGIDNVLNRERAPEVDRYVSEHYELDATIGDLRLARRKGPTR